MRLKRSSQKTFLIVIAVSIIYFVGVIIIAHFYSQPGYEWSQHTISTLAAQDHANKGIMQAGFIGFGILLNAGLISKFFQIGKINYPDVLLMLYGFAILVTGFFCEKPIGETISYSMTEARIHSIFATLAGIALSAGILWYWIAIDSIPEKFFHFVFLLLITGISLSFGLAESGTISIGKGIVQRSLYLVSLVWLFFSQRGVS
jgi:hypothetical protein